MDRIIKFRAWSVKDRAMLDWSLLRQTAFNADDERGLLYRVFTANDEDYILMQFTGLLDKNGVEIYEGDVLPGRHTTGNVIVVYDTSLASFELQDRADDNYSYSEHLLDVSGEHDLGYNPWKILGNIWESPELVK